MNWTDPPRIMMFWKWKSMKTLTSLEKIICQVEAAHGSYGIYTLKYQTCLFNLGVCFPFGNSSSTISKQKTILATVACWQSLRVITIIPLLMILRTMKKVKKSRNNSLQLIFSLNYVQNRIFGYSCRSSGVDFGFPWRSCDWPHHLSQCKWAPLPSCAWFFCTEKERRTYTWNLWQPWPLQNKVFSNQNNDEHKRVQTGCPRACQEGSSKFFHHIIHCTFKSSKNYQCLLNPLRHKKHPHLSNHSQPFTKCDACPPFPKSKTNIWWQSTTKHHKQIQLR